MSLNKFSRCNPAHESNLEYCCFKSNRVFCLPCWYKEGHLYKCYSSKCGHFVKLAHSTIEKCLEIKAMQYSSQMCSSYENYDSFYKNFLRFKITLTEKIKSDVESKLPLFIWTAISEMLKLKNPSQGNLLFEELVCADMLRVIKGGEESKVNNLEEVVRNYQKILYSYEGIQNKVKTKNYESNMDKQVEDIVAFCSQKLNQITFNLGNSLKKHMELEIGKLLKEFDPTSQFDGIKFINKKGFEAVQYYNQASLYSSLISEPGSVGALYHNTQLEIEKLEQCPQMLLQISKSILKQKIFQIHSNITQLKSAYPYKYGYLICTTLVPDPEYELCILNMEKSNIKSYEKRNENSFLNSINIVIMGPELITVQFRNYPKKIIEICIFGYVDSRDKHYTDIIDNSLGLGRDKTESKKITKHKFQNQLSLAELAYVEFELAYEHLFTDKENSNDFEGEKYILGRGIKLMQDIVSGWRANASIELPIQKNQQQYIPLFI